MGLGDSPQLWRLQPGCHRLKVWLENTHQQVASTVSSVFFEVEQASNEGSGQCRRLNCGETTTERIWTEDAEVAAISREEGLQVFVNADGSTKYFHSPRRRPVTSSG